MSQKFTIAARSPLMANILAGDTSLTVDLSKADLFPVADTGTDPIPTVGKDWFKVVLEDSSKNIEIVYVRTRASGAASMTNCLRGQEGTTARSYLAGSIVGLRHTAQDLGAAIALASGASTFWKSVLGIATAALSRVALGVSAVGDALFTAADAGAARTAIGSAASGPLKDSGITGASPRATRIDVATVAGVVNLTTGAPDTDDIQLTGTLQPTAFTVAVGRVLRVTVKDGFTLPNNAAIVTQTGANIVAPAGSTFMLRATAADVVELLGYVDPFVSVDATPDVPQTVLSGPVDTNGYSDFGGSTGTATLTTAATLRATCFAGAGLHRVGNITNAAFTSPGGTGTAYPYLEISAAGVVTAGVSTLPWIYQHGGTPSVTNGQHTVNIQEGKVYVGNGTVATQVYRVCVGQCAHTSGSWSGSPKWYAIKGRYVSTEQTIVAGTLVSLEHLIGCKPRKATHVLRCKSAIYGWAVGDEVFGPSTNPASSAALAAIGVNDTFVYMQPGNSANSYFVVTLGTGSSSTIVNADWRQLAYVERGW